MLYFSKLYTHDKLFFHVWTYMMETMDVKALVTNFIKERGYDVNSLVDSIRGRAEICFEFQKKYVQQLDRSYTRNKLLGIIKCVVIEMSDCSITCSSSDDDTDNADATEPKHATTLTLTCDETEDTLNEVSATINKLTTEMNKLKTTLNQFDQPFNEINQCYKEFQELKKQFTTAQERQSKEDITYIVATYTASLTNAVSSGLSECLSTYRDERQEELIKRINDNAATCAELERLRVTMLLKYNHDPTGSAPADVENEYNTICDNIKTVSDSIYRLTERINAVNNKHTTLKRLSDEYKAHMLEGNKRETVSTLAAFYKEADELNQYKSNQHP